MSTEGIVSPSGEASTVLSQHQSVYGELFEKINLQPVTALVDINVFQSSDGLAAVTADERVTAAVNVFLELLDAASQKVDRLDRNLLDSHIAALDAQISQRLDVVMHHPDFQRVESLWRGVKSLVDQTDFRQNVRIELLDVSKEHLVQDFEDAPEIAQSGLYFHTYVQEYDTPGGEPIASPTATCKSCCGRPCASIFSRPCWHAFKPSSIARWKPPRSNASSP
jgi:type VI secretion system protein ImpC